MHAEGTLAAAGGMPSELVSALGAARFAVYAPDLRGHGRSGGRRGSVERFGDYVDDVERFVETVVRRREPDGPLFVLGYSLGGLVGASYAIEHPDALAGLIMAAPALGVGDGVSPLQFRAASVLGTIAPRLPVLRMNPEAMMQDPAAVRALPQRIGNLRVPLLVLHGADDVTASPRASEAAFRLAGSTVKQRKSYPGCRHDLFNEPARGAVIADVVEWIGARVGAGPAAWQTEEERCPSPRQ